MDEIKLRFNLTTFLTQRRLLQLVSFSLILNNQMCTKLLLYSAHLYFLRASRNRSG